ncbi:hypothetical protein VTN77DRAFT_5465 [Rasamsonia byssochlamydoides]|uniref:uncharacterized protein n=1 Tax=Rasamsonia byssochlamydoides TaxID=89139 RepID=UPI0037429E2C
MSSDNDPQQKPSASTFADVFKTLASGRQKSLSPLSTPDNSGDPASNGVGGRRGSRVTFGFETMNRASIISNSSDTSSAPEFETALRNLQQSQNLAIAADEAESVAKFLHKFTPEQSIALWQAGAYLIHDEDSEEVRRRGSKLLEAIANRQDLSPAAMHYIFESISRPSAPDVIPARVNALIALSDNGRKLDFTDSSILPTLSACLVPLYKAVALARSKAKKTKVQRSNGSRYDDDANLNNLLQFVVDVITLQRNPASEEEIESLLNEIFTICKRTSVALDIKNSLAVFDAIVLYAEVPEGSFVGMLEVLCSIHASVRALSGPTSRVVRNLAKSRRQAGMVDLLHSFLVEDPDSHDRNLNVVRGAIDVFTDLVRAYGQEGLPQISFADVVNSLHVVARREGCRIEADVLELSLSMLDGEFASVSMQEPDWRGFVDLLILCSRHVIDGHDGCLNSAQAAVSASPSKTAPMEDSRSNIIANITRIAALIENHWERLNEQQQIESGRFLMLIHRHLSPTQARLLLNLFRARQSCFPGKDDWESQSRTLIRAFLQPSDKVSDVRILALETLKDAIFSDGAFASFQQTGLIESLLEDFPEEKDPVYLESLVSVMVDIAATGDDTMLRFILDKLSSPMTYDRHSDDLLTSGQSESRRSSAAGSPEPSLSNICSVGLVRLFLRFVNASADRAALLFEALIYIVRSWERPSDSRLTVLKLLFRLRCDSAGSIMVVADVENDFLVSVLSRTLDGGSKPPPSLEGAGADRASKAEDSLVAHTGRLSLKEQSTAAPLSKPVMRGSSSQLRRWAPPAWAYLEPKGLPDEPPTTPSPYVYAYGPPTTSNDAETPSEGTVALKINFWLETVIALLQRESDWDVYSYVLAHLGPQLGNRDFFTNAVPQIKLLRSILCDQIKNESFREPPGLSGIKKADVAICIFEALAMLISYHGHFAKSEQDELVRAFMLGIIGSWDGTSRGCIHALSVCCHEIPLSVTKSLNAILDKMSKVITMSHLAVHILEFLALLARLPDVYVNLREEEIRTVFGICIRFIQTSREQRYKATESPTSRNSSAPTRLSGGLREIAAAQAESSDTSWQEGISKYVYTLTYHVLVFWFLSLKLQDRAKHVNWITSRLIFTDEHGREVVEEQSEVFIDFMQRVTYSDLGDTIPFETFPPSPEHGPVIKKSWIVGMSIVTVETAAVSGLTQITKRMASGTTYAEYRQRTAPVLPHQVPPTPDAVSLSDASSRTAILPSHVLLQMTTTAFPTPSVMQPIPLPDDDITRRAIKSFDRNDIVDGHKVGVIFIDKDQTTEAEILANTKGSPDYDHFLTGLGTKVALRGAQFNTQGLHCDVDGEYTYAWRDRVTEIVYHIPTMMPTNLETDPSCINKKRHIGNDFVNIIFNRSNLPFNFETIPSQFNFINIVITPVSRIAPRDFDKVQAEDDDTDYNKQFYSVKVMTKPGFPELSPAATPKVISGKNLAAFVRILAMNASVFSLVWNREGGEHISSWRNRLREIKRLRERVLLAQTQAPADTGEGSYLGYRRNTKANLYPEDGPSRPAVRTDFSADWNTAADNNVFQALDFSRWTR